MLITDPTSMTKPQREEHHMNTDNGRKTDLAQRPLSFTEAVFLADNLETIDYFRDLQRRNKQTAS